MQYVSANCGASRGTGMTLNTSLPTSPRVTRILASLALALAATAAAGASELPTLDDANHAYYWGHYSRSLALYEQLAASGNAEAAERAGFMLLQGSALFGPDVRRDMPRAQALLTQAAKAGRGGAGFLLSLLDHSD